MSTITLQLPDELVDILPNNEQYLNQLVLEMFLMQLYGLEHIGIEQVAKLLNIPQQEAFELVNHYSNRSVKRSATMEKQQANAKLSKHDHQKPMPFPKGNPERAVAILRETGLLTELGPELKKRAARSCTTLEEIQDMFAQIPGKPLSEIVLEQRGPKG